MFILKNLVSSAITRGEPWTFKGEVPPEVREDKVKRDAWINNVDTQWNVYSMIEGLNENVRISLTNTVAREGNPPRVLHGFAADYDAKIPDSMVFEEIKKFVFKPRWFERTLSGNVRLVWFFEKPMLVPSAKFLTEFFTKVLEYFPADKLLPAFDKPAWTNPTRYYTNSGEWIEFKDAKPIPTERVQGWLVKVGEKFNWINESGAVEIPLEVLRPELLSKYPRFAEWPGEFVIGEQGPSFWLDNSTSPKSAQVRETGMMTFSAHATQAFYSWAQLLGHDFVKGYQADHTGRAVAGIHWDSQKYHFKPFPDSDWSAYDKTDIREFIRVGRRVSRKPDKQGVSDLDLAMQHIQMHQKVAGVASFVGRPDGVITCDGKLILNTNTRNVIQPTGKKELWGLTGGFPFLSKYFETLFGSADQLAYFLAWLKHFYVGFYNKKPSSGHAVFIAGPPNVGKSFLTQGIISMLMGGSEDASDILMGNTDFGSEMYKVPVWWVSDGLFASSARGKQEFTEGLKSIVANACHKCKEKYLNPVKVLWQGRAMIDLNIDAVSIQALPEVGASNMDKIMLFTTTTAEDMQAKVTFLTREENEETLARELPAFAQWLLDYQIEPQCVGNVRFGVVPYHDPALLKIAEQSSYTSGFSQILEHWRTTYFGTHKQEDFWEGSAHSLLMSINADQAAMNATRKYDANVITRQLTALHDKGHWIEYHDTEDNQRIWKLFRSSRKKKVT